MAYLIGLAQSLYRERRQARAFEGLTYEIPTPRFPRVINKV